MCHSRRRHHPHRGRDVSRPPAPPLTPEQRIADVDRDLAVTRLGEHAAAGRLSAEELDERADRALAARTRGELDAVFVDLPYQATRQRRARRGRDELAEHLRAFVLVNLLLIAIWAAAGAGYFWPIWPLLGWGIGLLSHAGALRSHAVARPSQSQ